MSHDPFLCSLKEDSPCTAKVKLSAPGGTKECHPDDKRSECMGKRKDARL